MDWSVDEGAGDSVGGGKVGVLEAAGGCCVGVLSGSKGGGLENCAARKRTKQTKQMHKVKPAAPMMSARGSFMRFSVVIPITPPFRGI